jgi:hypothetical protein
MSNTHEGSDLHGCRACAATHKECVHDTGCVLPVIYFHDFDRTRIILDESFDLEL